MSVPSVLAPAGPEAAALTEVAWVLIVGAATIAALTLGLAAVALRRPHRRELPIAWWTIGGGIVFPVLVLVPLLFYDVWRTPGVERTSAANELVVSVTGRMWWWDIRYVDPASGRTIRVANELRVPVGRPIRLALASSDVIHSFWVPELGGKVDMVPGRMLPLRFTAGRAGTYRGQCAEFCGEQHAKMALHVVAVAPDDFERWLAGQASDAQAPDSAVLHAGRQAFLDHGCSACHDVRGVAVGSERGPDLSHVASRLHLGAGVLRNGPGAAAAWISGVQALKPGAHMPAANGIDAATLAALSSYLGSLR
jgi:cytochrome c oxidase subunit II